MKNDLTNHSAGLMLDEDFVKRAVALRGGQNLDGDFLMDLLQAGLAIMELSANDRDTGCGDPDCAGCRIRRGEQPRLGMVAEFNAVQVRLAESLQARQSGQGTDREVTFALSETSLIFMAWLDRLVQQRVNGGLRIVGANIDPNRPADMKGAMRYLSNMLEGMLEKELADFAEGRHYLLFPPSELKPGPSVH